jgi:hypothetical protein
LKVGQGLIAQMQLDEGFIVTDINNRPIENPEELKTIESTIEQNKRLSQNNSTKSNGIKDIISLRRSDLNKSDYSSNNNVVSTGNNNKYASSSLRSSVTDKSLEIDLKQINLSPNQQYVTSSTVTSSSNNHHHDNNERAHLPWRGTSLSN